MLFSALISLAGISVAAQALAAVVLSWICVELYRGARNPMTHRSDAMMLDLGLWLQPSASFPLQTSIRRQTKPRKTLKPET